MTLYLKVNLETVGCVRCHKNVRLDDHHITYTPEKISRLCRDCHIGITALNVAFGLEYGRMTNADRRRVYNRFMKHKWRMEQESYHYKTFRAIRRNPECLKKLVPDFKLT